MKILDILNEVDIVPTYPNKMSPVKDNQTIRVYHAFNRSADAILACTHGISGKTYAQRIYSYESNNNPKGIFVTPDLKSAKEFGRVIIEFQCKVSDLEAPVWPNGSYTVQGQMSGSFDDDADRENRRMQDRAEHSKSEYPEISDSDRPELASKLLHGGERQSLFIGDLNPNSIRAIWIAPDLTGGTYKDAFTRMSRKEFLNFATDSKKDVEARGRDYRDDAAPAHKLFSPREEFNGATFEKRVATQYKSLKLPEVVKILNTQPDYMLKFFWPKQMEAAKAYMAANSPTKNGNEP